MDAIAAGDDAAVRSLLAASPPLARRALLGGATRVDAASNFLGSIAHYVYAGDTALHVAAAAHHVEFAKELIARGADVAVRNRRGATPLHYAADGSPNAPNWNPSAQARTILVLVESGADPNVADRGGVTPLHRAIRNRCAAAVRALLDGGADPLRANGSGSSPLMLATGQTGRGGSGSAEAKAQQAEIIALLQGGASPA
jgi:hypothetical protein